MCGPMEGRRSRLELPSVGCSFDQNCMGIEVEVSVIL